MGCHGGFSLDDSARRSWYNPEALLKDIGLSEGMVFVDVGSGEGFFSMLAVKFVGESGKVYAIDTDAAAIETLKRKVEREGINNLTAMSGVAEETIICSGCVDIIFYSMVLHDFTDPIKVLQNARQMLKPSGIVADLDWKKMQMAIGPPERIRFSEQHVSYLIQQAGLTVEANKDVGSYHYLVTARP